MGTPLGEVLEDSDRREAGGAGKLTITVKIRRYNPETRGDESWWDEFTVAMEPNDRLLDALHEIKWYQDGTLALRRSCAHGICARAHLRGRSTRFRARVSRTMTCGKASSGSIARA